MNGRDRFAKRYHRRIVEAAYSDIKAMHGASLRTRLMPTQTIEAMTHVILYDIEKRIRAQTNAGCLVEHDIQALVS